MIRPAALVVLLSGCSFFMPRGRDCVRSPVVPALDTVITVAMLTAVIYTQATHGCDRQDGCHNYNPAGLFLIPAIGYGIAAIYGFNATATCRAQAGRISPGLSPDRR